MIAFATHTDLGARLNRTFSLSEQIWVTTLLEDSADFMRSVMRNQVYPSLTSTYVAYPRGGRVALPQSFIRSVDSVIDPLGLAVEYELISDVIHVHRDQPLTVTFTYGLSDPPGDLIGINCALAGQMMMTVAAGLGLTAGGLSSVAIDDFKAAFADGGIGTGLSLTQTTRDHLIDHYGRSAWVVEASL